MSQSLHCTEWGRRLVHFRVRIGLMPQHSCIVCETVVAELHWSYTHCQHTWDGSEVSVTSGPGVCRPPVICSYLGSKCLWLIIFTQNSADQQKYWASPQNTKVRERSILLILTDYHSVKWQSDFRQTSNRQLSELRRSLSGFYSNDFVLVWLKMYNINGKLCHSDRFKCVKPRTNHVKEK